MIGTLWSDFEELSKEFHVLRFWKVFVLVKIAKTIEKREKNLNSDLKFA